MQTFFINYGLIIILFIGVIFYFGYIYKKKGKKEALLCAKEIAYKLMLAAQKKFGQDSGKEKFKWVIDRFYDELPDAAKMLLDKEDISQYLQKLYDEFKNYLEVSR